MKNVGKNAKDAQNANFALPSLKKDLNANSVTLVINAKIVKIVKLVKQKKVLILVKSVISVKNCIYKFRKKKKNLVKNYIYIIKLNKKI